MNLSLNRCISHRAWLLAKELLPPHPSNVQEHLAFFFNVIHVWTVLLALLDSSGVRSRYRILIFQVSPALSRCINQRFVLIWVLDTLSNELAVVWTSSSWSTFKVISYTTVILHLLLLVLLQQPLIKSLRLLNGITSQSLLLFHSLDILVHMRHSEVYHIFKRLKPVFLNDLVSLFYLFSLTFYFFFKIFESLIPIFAFVLVLADLTLLEISLLFRGRLCVTLLEGLKCWHILFSFVLVDGDIVGEGSEVIWHVRLVLMFIIK